MMKKIFIPLIAALLLMSSCDVFDISKDTADDKYIPTDKIPIASYLASEPEFSEYTALLNYADLFNALNQATTGVSFTAFVPTNEAMEEFYERRGVSSYEDLGKEYCKSFVLYHTVKDSLTTEQFVNLKAPITNLNEDQITVEIDSTQAGGALLNNEGRVTEMGLDAYNGKIYVLSRAMTPLTESTYQRVAEDAGSTIMAQALTATGWDKELNTLGDTVVVGNKKSYVKRYYTFLNVSDAAFAKDGIGSLADLQSALGGDEALKEYIAYHVLSGSYTVAALCEVSGSDLTKLFSTEAENQVISLTVNQEDAESSVFNESGFSASFAKGGTDILAKNGYVHNIDAMLPVWQPEQTTVIWDFADYGEVKSIVTNDLGLEYYQPKEPTAKEMSTSLTAAQSYTYEVSAAGGSNKYHAIDYYTCASTIKDANNNDRVVFNLGYMGWAQMKTPTLVKGRYKVELSLVYQASQNFMRTMTDGNGGMLHITFDDADDIYVAPYTKVDKILPGVYTSTLYDEIEFEETKSHAFKFVVLDPAASTNNSYCLQFDKITFVPVK